jgi:hypothetical protein
LRSLIKSAAGRYASSIRSICTVNNMTAFIIPLNLRGMPYQAVSAVGHHQSVTEES